MDIKETTVIDKTTGEVLDSTAEIIKYKNEYKIKKQNTNFK